jgi:hypothetical protein
MRLVVPRPPSFRVAGIHALVALGGANAMMLNDQLEKTCRKKSSSKKKIIPSFPGVTEKSRNTSNFLQYVVESNSCSFSSPLSLFKFVVLCLATRNVRSLLDILISFMPPTFPSLVIRVS